MRIWIVIAAIVLGLAGSAVWNQLKKPPTMPPGPLVVRAVPLVLDSDRPARTRIGPLHFLGAWHLTHASRSFGGISALAMEPDGTLLGLNDTGVVFHMPQPGSPGAGETWMLPRSPQQVHWDRIQFDSEALVDDHASGRQWVGIELQGMICRYAVGLTLYEACRKVPEMREWPATEGIETLLTLPGGRFLVVSEGRVGGAPGRTMLVYRGDPVAKSTPRPAVLYYRPPPGFDPTDGVWIGGGRVLLLNRKASPFDGFTAVLTLVDLVGAKPGAVLEGRVLARFAPPVLADNFEGMTLERRDGQRILWIVSDDNHLFFQRTILMKFALDANL